MAFTDAEIEYLTGERRLARLATQQPDGTLQNNPVGCRYNPETGTIDVGGHDLARTRKFRNVAENGRAAVVVDDVVSVNPWHVRCVEVRGTAEALDPAADPSLGLDAPVIRIHPHRVISFGLDGPTR